MHAKRGGLGTVGGLVVGHIVDVRPGGNEETSLFNGRARCQVVRQTKFSGGVGGSHPRQDEKPSLLFDGFRAKKRHVLLLFEEVPGVEYVAPGVRGHGCGVRVVGFSRKDSPCWTMLFAVFAVLLLLCDH